MCNIFLEVADSVHIKNLRHDLGDDVAKNYAAAVVMLYRTNLYGYTEKKHLLSFKYLKHLKLMRDKNTFEEWDKNPIVLTAAQFKTFVDLYDKDLKTVLPNETESLKEQYSQKELCESSEIQLLLSSENSKFLYWS